MVLPDSEKKRENTFTCVDTINKYASQTDRRTDGRTDTARYMHSVARQKMKIAEQRTIIQQYGDWCTVR